MNRPTRLIAGAVLAATAFAGCSGAADEDDLVDDNAPEIDQGTDAGDTSDSGERRRDNEDQNEGVNNAGDLDDTDVYED